jgi:cystathionine gamma-lyase
MESPTNPCMRVADLEAIATIVHNIRKDIIVLVDNTFQTPYFQVNNSLHLNTK